MIYELSKQQVAILEQNIDDGLKKIKIGNLSKSNAKWLLITAMDDSFRLFVFSNLRMRRDIHEVIMQVGRMIDAFKYSYKYLLEQIEKIEYSGMDSKKAIDWDLYGLYHELLNSYSKYDGIVRSFSSYFNKRLKIYFNQEENIYIFKHIIDDRKFDTLDYLIELNRTDDISFYTLLMGWLAVPQMIPEVVFEIIRQGSRIDEDTLVYHYDHTLAKKLNKYIEGIVSQKISLPKDWAFPWSSSEEALKVMRGFQIRCLYHLIMIYIGASRLDIRGGAVTSLCFVTTESKLCYELSKLCSLSQRRIKEIIRYFYYGFGVQTPDPILQPIVKLKGEEIGISAHQLITSDIERNMLSLHARINSTTFDNNSAIFEKEMNNKMMQILLKRHMLHRFNFYIPTQRQAGEVDLVLIDISSCTILCIEMRWMIQPGDARELQQRIKQAHQKVDQIQRKVDAISLAKKEILSSFKIAVDYSHLDRWNVNGVVIFDGFTGTTVESERGIPLVPIQVFDVGISHCDNLNVLYNWLQSHIWLPQENIHFKPENIEITIGDIHLIIDGYSQYAEEAFQLENYLVESISSFNEASIS